jgi:hypothetical protein
VDIRADSICRMTVQPRRDDPRAPGAFWADSSEFCMKSTLRKTLEATDTFHARFTLVREQAQP